METKKGKIRSNGKSSTTRVQAGYCNEATQRGPTIHSQSDLPSSKHIQKRGGKKRIAWTRKEMRELMWCYTYCRKYLTEKYKMVYEVWRKRNPEAGYTWTEIKSYTRKTCRDEQK